MMVAAAEEADLQMVAEEAGAVVAVLDEEDVDDQITTTTGMVARITSLNSNRNKTTLLRTSRIENRISNLGFITRSTALDRLKFATMILHRT